MHVITSPTSTVKSGQSALLSIFSSMNSLLSQPLFQGLLALWKGPAFLHFLANSSSKLRSFFKKLFTFLLKYAAAAAKCIVGVKNC